MGTDKPGELTLVGTLISNPLIHLELYENSNYNLFMAAACTKPEGTIYFATTTSLLCLFLEDKITLQDLLERCPSFFAEIVSATKLTSYSLKDSTIELKEGHKSIKQLTSDDPIEIW